MEWGDFRNFCRQLCALCAGFIIFSAPVYATDFLGTSTIYSDQTITDDINVKMPGTLVNIGTIVANIYIPDHYEFMFENSGQFIGAVNIGAGSHFTQIVRNTGDMGMLNISRGENAKFSVLADELQDIDFMDLAHVARDADYLELVNSTLYYTFGYDIDVPVLVNMNGGNGVVQLHIANIMGHNGDILFPYYDNGIAPGAESFPIIIDDGANMFNVIGLHSGDNYILSVTRNTDYEKIVGGSVGNFINNMRRAGVHSGLIKEMDNAENINTLREIMNDSVVFNPIKLAAPMRAFARDLADTFFADGANNGGGAGGANFIFGDNAFIYGARAGMDFNLSRDFALSVYAIGGGISSSGTNDFTGDFFGGMVRGAYSHDWLSAAIALGAAHLGFNTGAIYGGRGGVMHNPDGAAYFGNANVSARVYNNCGFYVAPILSARFFIANIAHDSESEFSFGGGARAGYKYEMLGVQSDYSAYATGDNDGYDAGVRMDVSLPDDNVMFGLNAGIMQMDGDNYYKFGANIVVEF